MTFNRTATLLIALAALASCAPVIGEGCAGWRPVRIAESTLDHMAAHDTQALAALIAHQEFGQARGCW